ncbi:MAG: tRNA pseudouridine(55) synthase TruB [bacterium]|nr:tRNA pseudouridine(55) synthase TruB [bacterium]
MDGIINVYKEAGFTSHDVVAKLRGILHQKKIGHTGTLDPAATGVLPVCLGKATKVCELLTEKDKTYQAVCKLGVVTDTQDMTGQILEENDITGITPEEIYQTVDSFLGDSMQIPPMYSALKVNGKKLYELAREGKEVERKPRPIRISHIEIRQLDIAEQTFTMEVTCSKGTYIRTLCHDIGQKLGVGAAMQNLVRTRVANFSIEDAMTLDTISNLVQESEETFMEKVYSVDSLFPTYPKFKIKPEFARKLANGNILYYDFLESWQPEGQFRTDKISDKKTAGDKCLIYDENGEFKAVYRHNQKDFTVIKMF